MKKIEDKKGVFDGELTDTQAIKLLKDALKARKQAQYPNVPEYAITIPKYEDRTANGLTRCIIDFLNSQNGCCCFRISNEGIMRIDKNGKAFRATSSMQNGISDLISCVWGRFVSIEVKVNKDVQSQAQIDYQRQIENACGYYVIAKDFKGFLDWFNLKKGGENGR